MITKLARVDFPSIPLWPFPPKQSEAHAPFLASTPAWVKRGLVKLKSLDYTFSDDNTAIPTPKQGRMDARAYRHQILAGKFGGKKGRLISSEGHYLIKSADLSAAKKAVHDVTKSPGFRREMHVDKQKKHEMQLEHGMTEVPDNKSSFAQCTFNMANILMVRSSPLYFRVFFFVIIKVHLNRIHHARRELRE
jgi:hypothetical protein